MKYLESKLVALLTLSTGLYTIYGSRSTIYREETRTGDNKWTKSFPNVYSEIACGVICAGDTELCKIWQYIPEQSTCHISTDKTTGQGKVWSVVETQEKVFCRLPFNNSWNQNEGKHKPQKDERNANNITNKCAPEFCFIETRGADNCRRTGKWTAACGRCKRIEWRSQIEGKKGVSMVEANVPSLVREGWRVILNGKINSTGSSFLELVTSSNKNLRITVKLGEESGISYKNDHLTGNISVELQTGIPFEIKLLVKSSTFELTVNRIKTEIDMVMSLDDLTRLAIKVMVNDIFINSMKFIYPGMIKY